MALLQLLLQQRAMRAMPLPARWQPALLNLLKALVLTGGATAETWLPLEYAQAADGFDAHDDHSAGKVISAPAMCAVQGGVVQLKGCAVPLQSSRLLQGWDRDCHAATRLPADI